MAEEEAMPMEVPTTKTGRVGQRAARRNPRAPIANSLEAACPLGQPRALTPVTISGVANRPRAPLPATKALTRAPVSNQRTAMSRRKVVPAVSIMPAVPDRQSSKKNVRRVRFTSEDIKVPA